MDQIVLVIPSKLNNMNYCSFETDCVASIPQNEPLYQNYKTITTAQIALLPFALLSSNTENPS